MCRYINLNKCTYTLLRMNIHMCIFNSKTQQPTVSPLHRSEKFENSIKSKIYAHTGFSFSRNGGGSLWEQFQLN